MKKILSIVWYRVLPPVYGGQKGIAFFNACLAEKLPLTCLCSRDNQPTETLPYTLLNELPVSRFQFWNPLVRKNILGHIRNQSYTHIFIEHPYHAWLGRYKQRMGFQFIVHAHNIEHIRMRARRKAWWRLLRQTERKAMKRADRILFKTKEDKNVAIALFGIDPGKCLVIPYGTMLTRQPSASPGIGNNIRSLYNIADSTKILLFAGTLNYEPNTEALDLLLREVLPLLAKRDFPYRLLICGALPARQVETFRQLPHITATGFADSIEDYLQVADVFVNPVVSGSGIQTKTIEAIASGSNVVSTRFAAQGLPEYLEGIKTFISPDSDWHAFADNIIKAANHPAPVPEQFYRDYNWQQIIDRLIGEL